MMRALILAAGLALAAPALAQAPALSTTGQPTRYHLLATPYLVTGYRSAKFGMTPAEVRAAAAADFPAAVVSDPIVDPVRRTTVMVASVERLAPAPGPASVSYIFGAASGRLIHINVDWVIPEPDAGQREAMVLAGSQVTAGLVGYYWKLLTVARGVPVGPNSLILFAGTGEAGGLVEVRLGGVAYTVKTADGIVSSPEPVGPATLHLAFAEAERPDVYTIKPGEF